ncbi:DUF1648 domain-containing protein [Agromyces sp. LHK192]|uniref:DUF1648 domain-containing protein n=1 Tax=Agromyces sp. LHK192 TaxID=2498704 RepID=UPI000FDA8991|nr:DUF1648 domain-containing protein [Agromyces sp. LHK192]
MTDRHDDQRPSASAPAPAPADADRVAQHRRDRRILWLLVVWVPLAIVALATVIQLGWAHRLPEEIAIHFDAAGQPDNWATPTQALFAYLAIAVSLVVALALATFAGRQALAPGVDADARLLARVRFMAAIAPAIALLLAVITLSLTGTQLDDGVPAAWAIPVIVIGGIVVSGLVAWLIWRALPAPVRGAVPDATPALALAPGERAVWTESVTAPWAVLLIVGLASAWLVVPIVMAPAAWWLWGILLVVVLALATTLRMTVTVDRRGLTARTMLGFRLTRVPLDRVESAADVEVLPGEFGGWGFRFDGQGRRGIILRGGPGIEVRRTDAPTLVVTVPDARTGAALLNALAAAARG